MPLLFHENIFCISSSCLNEESWPWILAVNKLNFTCMQYWNFCIYVSKASLILWHQLLWLLESMTSSRERSLRSYLHHHCNAPFIFYFHSPTGIAAGKWWVVWGSWVTPLRTVPPSLSVLRSRVCPAQAWMGGKSLSPAFSTTWLNHSSSANCECIDAEMLCYICKQTLVSVSCWQFMKSNASLTS